MVGNTLQIVYDLDENDARCRIALSSGKAVDVPDLQIVSQLVDLVLDRRAVLLPGLGVAHRVRLARADLSAICRAVNVLTPSDSIDLHNLPLVIKVHCRKDKNTGEITNDIRGYESKANYKPEPKQAPATPATAQTPRVPSKPPWM